MRISDWSSDVCSSDLFDQGLADIITEVEAVSQGFVKDVWVSEVDEESASAVVSVDVEHDGSAGPRTIYDLYFRVTLLRDGGEWKVDQVSDLTCGSGSGSTGTGLPTDPTATASTSIA